jgi:hypothetical protein
MNMEQMLAAARTAMGEVLPADRFPTQSQPGKSAEVCREELLEGAAKQLIQSLLEQGWTLGYIGNVFPK